MATNTKVYALKANYNRLLDVARETYKENVGDVHALHTSLKAEHNLPFVLIYKERGGGFWLTLGEGDVEEGLPRGCLNVSVKGGKFTFTTLELVSRIFLGGIGERNNRPEIWL